MNTKTSRGRNLNTLLTCETCSVSKLSADDFRRNKNSKTGYEYKCKQCRKEKAEIKQWKRRVEGLQKWHKERERRAGSCLLGSGISVQREHRFPTQVIYTLSDPRTKAVYYVGRTGNPKRRFEQHWYNRNAGTNELKCEWIDELRALGLRPSMVIVEDVKSPNRKAVEREHRWLFHLIQQNAPLTNREASIYPRLVKAIQGTTINFLTEPLRSKVWCPLYRAHHEDSIMLLKFQLISSYQWRKLNRKEKAQIIAKEVAKT